MLTSWQRPSVRKSLQNQVRDARVPHSHATPPLPKRVFLIENFFDLPCICFTPPRKVQAHASEGKVGRFATNRQRLTDLAADAAGLRKSKKSSITLFVKVATSCPMDWWPGRTKCRTE
jgi:hypothetical protein